MSIGLSFGYVFLVLNVLALRCLLTEYLVKEVKRINNYPLMVDSNLWEG